MTTTTQFTLKWGILATGGIAKTFTKDLLIDPTTRNASDIRHQIVAAASSTSLSRAQTFLEEIGAPKPATPYGSYADLVADPNIDIIYVASPHSHHYQHARLALEAGKHVLCEKAFTVNAAQTQILIDIAKKKNLFLMEAVWTRFFPLAREVRELAKSGKIGEVKRVWADLSFWKDVEGEFGTEHRMVNLGLAGGALLDLGIYSLTWVFQILYNIVPEDKRGSPSVASSMTKYDATGCDETTSIILNFPGGAQGIATTSLRVAQSADQSAPTVRIQGTLGDISIPFPCYRPLSYTLVPSWNDKRGTPANLSLETITHDIPGGGHGMFFEADECARCVRDGKRESEGMPWDESLVVMIVMDEVRKQGKLTYGDLESVEFSL